MAVSVPLSMGRLQHPPPLAKICHPLFPVAVREEMRDADAASSFKNPNPFIATATATATAHISPAPFPPLRCAGPNPPVVSMAAAHLGILLACVVLFVPMGLAGLHLSRNKMLFFSGVLFISLAVLVHVAPYLPSLLPAHLTAAVGPTDAAAALPLSCLSSLHSSVSFLDSSAFSFSRSTGTCRFQAISRPDALDLLHGSWILAAGDSQSRLLVLSLISLLLGDDPAALAPARDALFRRHSDYQIQIPRRAIRLDFLWSPFEPNISSSLRSLNHRPDVLVAGSGLWHMLHVTNATDYGRGLAEIKKAAEETEEEISSHAFWLGMPALVEEMLNTEEKRARMNATAREGYEREIEKAGILRREGGPFWLLDVGMLSGECGRRCTADGMHYNKVLYDALVQVMLNALLIESQQRA